MKPLSNLNATSMKRIGDVVGKSAQSNEPPLLEAEEALAILDGMRGSLKRINGDILTDYTADALSSVYDTLTSLLEDVDPSALFIKGEWY